MCFLQLDKWKWIFFTYVLSPNGAENGELCWKPCLNRKVSLLTNLTAHAPNEITLSTHQTHVGPSSAVFLIKMMSEMAQCFECLLTNIALRALLLGMTFHMIREYLQPRSAHRTMFATEFHVIFVLNMLFLNVIDERSGSGKFLVTVPTLECAWLNTLSSSLPARLLR